VVSALEAAESATEVVDWDDLDDLDEDCDGIVVDGGGVGALDSATGLGFARLREPIMAQIERGGVRFRSEYLCFFFCFFVEDGFVTYAVVVVVVGSSSWRRCCLALCCCPVLSAWSVVGAALPVGSSPLPIPSRGLHVRHPAIGGIGHTVDISQPPA
jgi:hypothetical protein